jgi:hypothetical protein
MLPDFDQGSQDRSPHTVEVVREPLPGELARMLREQAGLDVAALVPAGGGESGSAIPEGVLKRVRVPARFGTLGEPWFVMV